MIQKERMCGALLTPTNMCAKNRRLSGTIRRRAGEEMIPLSLGLGSECHSSFRQRVVIADQDEGKFLLLAVILDCFFYTAHLL